MWLEEKFIQYYICKFFQTTHRQQTTQIPSRPTAGGGYQHCVSVLSSEGESFRLRATTAPTGKEIRKRETTKENVCCYLHAGRRVLHVPVRPATWNRSRERTGTGGRGVFYLCAATARWSVVDVDNRYDGDGGGPSDVGRWHHRLRQSPAAARRRAGRRGASVLAIFLLPLNWFSLVDLTVLSTAAGKRGYRLAHATWAGRPR